MADPVSIGPWMVIEKLGEGGQGVVYLVQSQERHLEREAALHQLVKSLRAGASMVRDQGDSPRDDAMRLANGIGVFLRPDTPKELGAGKRYSIPGNGPESNKALDRLRLEFEILESTDSPHVLRLLHRDLGSKLMITEYHPDGALHKHLTRFKGEPVQALVALRGIVAAVADLHRRGVIHRDIKPANILVARDGRLVLGDFGIVFLDKDDRTRITDTFERVGTRDWMPPWAHTGTRIDDVQPSFDVFCLGKVLWSMLSGRATLPYWYWRKDPYDLVKMFPAQATAMELINERILAATVVEEEPNCLDDAGALRGRIDEVIETLQHSGQIVGDRMRCVICGRGMYAMVLNGDDMRILALPKTLEPGVGAASLADQFINGKNHITVRPYRCTNCGHLALFQFPDGSPHLAWEK